MPRCRLGLGFFLATCTAFLAGQEGWEAILGMPRAFAQAGGDISTSVMTALSLLIGLLITAMNILLWVLFKMLDIVMDPVFIFDTAGDGSGGGLLFTLHEVWQLSRDLVNIGFAILLIVAAVLTVITAKTDEVKSRLPKFVIAVVLVNFSWFIPRVLFDASQILTYTIYQIPSLVGAQECTLPQGPNGQPGGECEIVTNVVFFEATETIVPGPGGLINLANNSPGWVCPLRPLVCYQSLPMSLANLAGTSIHTQVLNGLIINHAKLKSLATLSDPGPLAGAARPDTISRLLSFIIKMILALVIHIALFFPILALTVAFFIRIPILWVTMAFMPFVAIGYVIGDKMGEFNPLEKIWKTFLTVVFLPAMVAVPFTIGFIMLNTAANITPPASFFALDRNFPVFTGLSNFWQLLWMLVALFILWSGVFAVLKKNEIIGRFTEGIKKTGEDFGHIALKAPLSVPWIPAPGAAKSEEKISPLQLWKFASPRAIRSQIEATGRAPDINAALGGGREAPGPDRIAELERKISGLGNRVDIHQDIVNNVVSNANADDAKRQAQRILQDLKRANADLNVDVHGAEAVVNALVLSLRNHGQAVNKDAENKIRQAFGLQPKP